MNFKELNYLEKIQEKVNIENEIVDIERKLERGFESFQGDYKALEKAKQREFQLKWSLKELEKAITEELRNSEATKSDIEAELDIMRGVELMPLIIEAKDLLEKLEAVRDSEGDRIRGIIEAHDPYIKAKTLRAHKEGLIEYVADNWDSAVLGGLKEYTELEKKLNDFIVFFNR